EHPDSGDIRAAVVLRADPNQLILTLQSGVQVVIGRDGLKAVGSALTDKASPKNQIRRGSIIRIRQDKDEQWHVLQMPEVEGALVSMDPRTGVITAMAGGFDFNRNKFNHVTQAWRQPGSSFKPFIYSAALEKGFTPATVVQDEPLFFGSGVTGSQAWEPKN